MLDEWHRERIVSKHFDHIATLEPNQDALAPWWSTCSLNIANCCIQQPCPDQDTLIVQQLQLPLLQWSVEHKFGSFKSLLQLQHTCCAWLLLFKR